MVWKRTALSWKTLGKHITILSPRTYDEWLSADIWWSPGFNSIGPNFSKKRASQLHNKGLQFIRDIWDHASLTFVDFEVLQQRYGMLGTEEGNWATVSSRLTNMGSSLFIRQNCKPDNSEWVGFFRNHTDTLPISVFLGRDLINCRLDLGWQEIRISHQGTMWSVQASSRTMVASHLSGTVNQALTSQIEGFPVRVRVQEVARGQKRIFTKLYCGRISELHLDTDRIKWPDNTAFFQYSTQLGRKILAKQLFN